MNFLLLAIIVFISPLSETQDLLLPFPKLRDIFSKLKKRQDGGYLEQCGVVEFGERNLGSVNVLAFFDASWQYSHRQAAMLKDLKGRFERSGMVNIKFFVINALPEAVMGEAEDEVEEETWKAISPSEAEGFPLVETSLGSLKKTLGPEFYLIEDEPQLQIWKKLHVSRDQILVVDSCGKLTYQVIVPWSILHFPYVKAAILSTYKDEPCGKCKQEKLEGDSTFYGPVNDEEFTTIGYGSDVPEGIVEEEKREEVTTETKEDERTTVLSDIEESTTEKMGTKDFFRTVVLRMDETTVEQMKTDGTTTEQIETDGTILVPLKTEDSTTEAMKTTQFLSEVPIQMVQTTTEQIKTDGTTTEEMETTIFFRTVPSKIDETTTEKMETTEFLTTIPLKMDATTTEQIQKDGTTTEQMETTEFLAEIPIKMDETTVEQITTDGQTTEHIKMDGSTTEEIETTEFLTTIPSKMDETTIEQIKQDGTTTEQIETTEFLTKIPLKMDETTVEQIKSDGTTTEQIEIDGTTIFFQPEETTDYIKTLDTEFPTTIIEKPFLEAKMHIDYPIIGNDYQEKDTKPEEQGPEKETLKLSLHLENDKSEVPEHNLSKSPNVRSIFSENYKNTFLDENLKNGSDKNEGTVPIRIIMKAPHLDIYENSLIKHDYLILKTGDPDLHDHLDQGIKIESLDKNFNLEEGSADFENWTDIWKIEDHNPNQNEDEINNDNNNKRKNGWYGFHIKVDDNKDSRKIKKRVFGKDESPGLFGEVADYWRNDGIENFYDESFDNEDDKMYDMEKDPIDNAENSFNATEEKPESEVQKENIRNSFNNEEEAKSKLIAHYSKLLPWIYYVLN